MRRVSPSRQRRANAPAQSGAATRRALPVGLWLIAFGVALVSCTLTGGDYEPALTESARTQPAAVPEAAMLGAAMPEAVAGAAMPDAVLPEEMAATEGVSEEASTPALACSASSGCPDGFECAGDTCVPSACTPGEQIASCVVDVCTGGDCAAACSDGVQGEGETGVDCGGPCQPCESDAGCSSDAECAPLACVAGRCAEPTCDDGVRNQDEGGPDCGGASCGPCAAGVECGVDSDCEEGLFCAPTTNSCSPVSCDDGVQNGAERGVDCGGGVCPGCAAGAPCEAGSDCASRSCVDSRCAEPTCDDGVRNGGESDVDCGGDCDRCASGLACTEPADCSSGVCEADDCRGGIASCCQAPTCNDGVRNRNETAIDCGAAPCPRCRVGVVCTQNVQCASNVCGAGGRCAELCDDGVRNGDEGGADCGGSEFGCPRCADGVTCQRGSDCASGTCSGGRCVSCADGLQNGDEGGVDCGGSEPGCPACPRCTVETATDLGAPGTVVGVNADGCARITAFPGYAPTRLDSVEEGPYPVPFSWAQACSAQSGDAVFEAEFQVQALPGLSIDCPVLIEFSGSADVVFVRWF